MRHVGDVGKENAPWKSHRRHVCERSSTWNCVSLRVPKHWRQLRSHNAADLVDV